MKCRNCGAEIPDNALVCGKCGTPVKPFDSAEQRRREEEAYRREESRQESQSRSRSRERQPRRPEDSDGFAKTSLVLGILSILSLVFPYLTIPLSLAAIGLGFLGLGSTRRTRAIVGIVLGAVMLLTAMTLLIALAALAPYNDDLIHIFDTYMQQLQ